MKNMKVSICIPAYNAEKTIKRAVDSALAQDFPVKDFEVVVVNDGSIDNTGKILLEFKDKIKVINQQNQGAVPAANKAFKEAKGEYVVKLDADDTFEPQLLKEMAMVLDTMPEIDFVYSDYYEQKQGKTKIVSTKHNIFNTIAIGIMFRKQKFASVGFYNEKVIFAEYDLLLRVLDKWKGFYIQKPLFTYIRRDDSITAKKGVELIIAQLKKEHPDKIEQIKKIRAY